MHPHEPPIRAAGVGPIEPKPRLLALFVGIGVVIVAASLFAVLLLREADRDSERIARGLLKQSALVGKLRQEFLLIRVAEKNLIIEDAPSERGTFERRIADSRAEVDALLASMESDGLLPEDRLGRFNEAYRDFGALLDQTLEMTARDTLARAAALSRGPGREEFQVVREALLEFIERGRRTLLERSGDASYEREAARLTERLAGAREALEGMHDLLYFQQASLTVFSAEERRSLLERIDTQIASVGASLESLRADSAGEDAALLQECAAAFVRWSERQKEVQALAIEDSKGEASRLSSTAVRGAYLKASAALDRVMQEIDTQTAALHTSQERALATGRNLLFGLALAGLAVVILTAWMAVSLIMREYRAVAEMLLRGP